MRPSVHVNRPLRRPEELDVVRGELSRDRIVFLGDAEAAAVEPVVDAGMGPADELGDGPVGDVARIEEAPIR